MVKLIGVNSEDYGHELESKNKSCAHFNFLAHEFDQEVYLESIY